MSRSQKLEKVVAWLKWVMASTGDLGDEFDLEDEETVDDLHRLLQHSRDREQDLKLLMDFQRHQIAEYERESERMIKVLDSCGLRAEPPIKQARQDLFNHADIVSKVAHSLGIDNPSKGEMQTKLAEVRLEAVKVPLKKYLLAKQVDSDKAEALRSLKSLQRTELAQKFQAEMAAKDDAEVKHLKQRTAFFVSKQNEYSRNVERFASIVEKNGFRDEIAHEQLLAKKAELDRIKDQELKPLKQKLAAFKSLPPDFELAQAKLAEAESKLEELNSQMMRKIAAMQL